MEQFHKWIKVFGKKMNERMLIKKMWNYTMNLKEKFINGKSISCSEKRGKKYKSL